jgi:hypothetical protein
VAVSAADLLRAAAIGRIGVDQRLLRSILDRGPDRNDAAASEVLAFARESRTQHRVDLDPLLVDLFRHFRTPEAVDFFIDAIRRAPEDVDDSLIQALLPFGEKAVDPLLRLYQDLGEEQGSDVAFLLAGLRVRDPRVLTLLLERLEFDAADGAFCLGLYGDPAARPELEKMLAEIPDEDVELRREIAYALEELDAPAPHYQPELFDIFADYPARQLPRFDVLAEPERIELLASSDPEVRAEAAYSFFNTDLHPKARAALLEVAKADPDANVRGRAWESLADIVGEDAGRETLLAILKDTSKPIEERGGAVVGLYPAADREDVRREVEALYEEGGLARAKALESMWRSLYKPYAKYFAPHLFAPHLDDPPLNQGDLAILKQALRGAGYFRLTRYADKIATYFEGEGDLEDLRDDALFAYALAMPGETTRGRARGMLRKVDSLTHLDDAEIRLVMFAIDERLRLYGLDPVFENESEIDEEPEPKRSPEPPGKPGRNDPCPCGSGKKYKKCHGK